MKMSFASIKGFPIATIIMLCALQTGGWQRQANQHAENDVTTENCYASYTKGCYEKIVATIPVMKTRVEYLSRVADDLQTQANFLQTQVSGLEDSAAVARGTKAGDLQKFSAIQDQINVLASLYDDVANKIVNDNLQLKHELNEFKDAACPLLRTLRTDDTTRINLGYACGFH
jgi:hypothetical protein